MKEKKTAVITFRTEQWTKEALERIANTNKWSVAQTVNELCKKYAINPRPEQIIIKASDLIKLVNEIKAEGENKAVRLIIDLETDGETAYKTIRTEVGDWHDTAVGLMAPDAGHLTSKFFPVGFADLSQR